MRLTTYPTAVLLLGSVAACGSSTKPTTWSLGSETMTALVTGTNSPLSSEQSFRCPDGDVATGFQGRTGLLIDQIQLTCRPLNADGLLGSDTLSGILGTSTGGTAVTNTCPSVKNSGPSVLVGDSGTADGDIHQVIGQCRLLADIAASANNATTDLRTGQLGGGPFQDSQPYDLLCPDGAAVTGLRGRYATSSGYVDEIGYFCRAVLHS
jgi:hypothetical protein